MDVCETKNIDLFNKVLAFEPMKVHTVGRNIKLIRLFSLEFCKTLINALNSTFVEILKNSKTTDTKFHKMVHL